MLLCFPDPYPDELLYSICARFNHHMRYPYAYSTILDLFGQMGRIAVTDLPGHLSCLADNLIQKDYYTVENLINNHTLLPFYEPFLSDIKIKQIRSDMAENKSFIIYPFSRSLICGVLLQEWLRFCPLCVEDDRNEFGECYWHRIHQIPGVEVCTRHNVFLQNSTIHKRKTALHHQISSAEEVIKTHPPTELDLSKGLDKILLLMGNSASWLFQQQGFSKAPLDQRYNNFVLDQGWFRDELIFTIDYNKLLEEFKNCYDDNILQYFSGNFDEQLGKAWPFKLVQREDIYHPIHHLIFIHFMKFNIADFFSANFDQKYADLYISRTDDVDI